MNCPYCAESIADQAVVCRWCRRDLNFFAPIQSRLKNLEDRVACIEVAISTVASGPQVAQPLPPDRQDAKMPVWKGVAYGLTASLAIKGISGFIGTSFPHLPQLLSAAILYTGLLSDICFGIWLGFACVRWTLRLPIALASAFLGECTLLAAIYLTYGTGLNTWNLVWASSHAYQTLKRYAIPFCLAILSSSWVADWLRAKQEAAKARTISISLSGIGRTLLTQNEQESTENFYARAAKLTSIISGMAPVLSFLGTIAVALIGLVGTLSKPGIAK